MAARQLPLSRSAAPARATATWLVQAGGAMAGLLGVVLFELALVGTVLRPRFAGSWEVVQARRLVAPIALAMLAPVALVLPWALRLVEAARTSAALRAVLAAVGSIAAGALAYGVSFGRHMQAPALRVPFIVVLAAVGGAAGGFLPGARARLSPRSLAAAGVLVAVAAWGADRGVLPGLYPAFHAALFVALVLGAGIAGAELSGGAAGGPASPPSSPPSSRSGHGTGNSGAGAALALLLLTLGGMSVAWAPRAAAKLSLADNLRFVLSERTAVLGRAVELAAVAFPPPPIDEPADTPVSVTAGEIPRALDWTGHDILLVSIDALRADHVSAYGYARPTTPRLDALAREGALFEAAYCPTPHTSYSVTSMMTGKAMRPLMSLGLGADAETWASQLRRYGYKTAAFYPPAVFYIDAERFASFQASHLDFEYAKVQFSRAADRVGELRTFLDAASTQPLFVWVHLFEPHEPYVVHEGHAFGGEEPKPIDAYDSEVAYADAALGELVTLMRARRPGTVVVVTADHGEEFGEHGGSYHGTSCYEEQVHVPLVVVGPGVAPRRVTAVAQTIDLLPTALSALGIPRPARVRGADLGPLLGGKAAPDGPGLAYAETDGYALLARGSDRLVCARKAAACALYDLKADPGEQADTSGRRPEVARELRGLLAGVERDQGRYEGGQASWPEPIRRGLMRDKDAAGDAAGLLEDADVAIRRKAGEVTYLLHDPEVALQVRRALAREEDPEVAAWCALALVRMGDRPLPSRAEAALSDPDAAWRRRAALAFALQGDPRGGAELVAEWREHAPPRGGMSVEDGKEILAGLARIRATDAVPALLDSLPFVPLRPFIADALGAIGDARAREPLLSLLGDEPHEMARSHEARALFALGVREPMRPPLERAAGLPEPMVDAIVVARDAGLLLPETGGIALGKPSADVTARVRVTGGEARLLVLAAGLGGTLTGEVGGEALGPGEDAGPVHIRELKAPAAGDGVPGSGASGVGKGWVVLRLHEPQGLLAAWVVKR